MNRAQVLKCHGKKNVFEFSNISIKECIVLDMGYKNIWLIGKRDSTM